MEKELLAALVVDISQLEHVAGIVRDRDFVEPVYRRVYQALTVMAESRIDPNDLAVLVRHLKSTGMSVSEIASLVGSGVAANALYYAREVSDAGRRRRLSLGLSEALDTVSRDGEDLERVISDLKALIEQEAGTAGQGAVHLSVAGDELLERLREQPKEAICFSGIWGLDSTIGGFMGGETVVIAARPGVGKTALAMQIGMHNAEKGRPGLFCSLEMSRTELVGRVLCGMSEVDGRRLRRGELSQDEVARIAQANEQARGVGCWVWDPPVATIDQLRSAAKLAALRHGIRWLVVDYIGLIGTGGRRVDRREHIGTCSRALKELSKDLGIPVFVLSQLNREAATAEPGLQNLRESGDVEQDADLVMFIHKTRGEDDDDRHQLIVAKNRHGQTGSVDVGFNGAQTRFTNVV